MEYDEPMISNYDERALVRMSLPKSRHYSCSPTNGLNDYFLNVTYRVGFWTDTGSINFYMFIRLTFRLLGKGSRCLLCLLFRFDF